MFDTPYLIMVATVWAYWLTVGTMAIIVRSRTRRLRSVLVPRQLRERLMWLVWGPLVGCWLVVPIVATNQRPEHHPLLTLPYWAMAYSAVVAVRWIAACVMVACWVTTIRCYMHMGRQWAMGIEPDRQKVLFTEGPFAWVRHPIYTCSIVLMTCSVVVSPTVLMLVLAVLHLSLLNIKARNEEQFMLRSFSGYADYCQRTGRFFPRWCSSAPSLNSGRGESSRS